MKQEAMKRLRCRPGDLAIVTSCRVPERLGLLVRVIERSSDAAYDWLVELSGSGIEAPGVTTGIVMNRTRAVLRDGSLTPIGADPHPYQTALPNSEAYEAST